MAFYLTTALIKHIGYICFFTKTNNISENILALITFFHILNYFLGILAKNWDYKIKKS